MNALAIDLEHARIPEGTLRNYTSEIADALAALERAPDAEFLRLPDRRDLLREIRTVVRARPAALSDVVQLGIGGSSLGAQALCGALLPARHNERQGARGMRFHFADNVDPESFGALLDSLPPRRTLVHVVSKSGGTLETLAQLHTLLDHFRRADARFSPTRQLVVTTGEGGPLRALAAELGAPVLTFPEPIGGRFSALTASGLLVPALCGVPVARVLAGARAMRERCLAETLCGPAGRLALLGWLHDAKHGRRIHVELVYADALLLVGDWFRQLLAESVGKQGAGPTPVVSRGTTDQHSQLQLYVDGPDDKLYSALRVTRLRRRLRVSRRAEPAILRGRDLGEIFDAEAAGTQEALVACGRPLVELRLPAITPEAVGELLLLRELQTALAGTLYGVDPFDQPGVEAGKKAALRILSSGSPSA